MFHIFGIQILNLKMKFGNNTRRLILAVMVIFLAVSQYATSQVVAGLDNWYNHETKNGTNKPYHYIWSDTETTGFSRWGDIFTSRGAGLTAVGKPTIQALSKVNIYIIADPDSTSESPYPNYIAAADIKTIKQWVSRGGVLVVMANDAPNCEFTHLNMLMKEFGMTFNHVTLHQVPGDDFEQGASINLPANVLFKDVRKIFMKDVSDLSIMGTATSLLTENGKVLIAENRIGRGYVIAIGDPWIYNEYIDHDRLPADFNNRKAAENLTDMLLGYVKKK
jgi:unsaturated rhamnogalacturonyl hydrolase